MFTPKLHCNSGITSSHIIYRQTATTDSPNNQSILLPFGQRCQFNCFHFVSFFSLRKEYYDCNGADPELKMPLRADPKWAASLKTTTHRHLIVTECEVVHWANTPLIHREKAVTFKVRPKPQVPSTTSHTDTHTPKYKHPQHA